jgi:hypothetical protein
MTMNNPKTEQQLLIERQLQENTGRNTVGKVDTNGAAPLRNLLVRDEDIRDVYMAMEKAILRSVGVDIQREPFSYLAQKGMTAAEMKRRMRFCIEWVREARAERGYCVQKTIDLLPHMLRCKLDGIDWDPDTSQISMWVPT